MSNSSDKEFAEKLVKAVDERNLFIRIQGDFDNFFVISQVMPGLRAEYDRLEKRVALLRAQLDAQVSDKKELVKSLKEDKNCHVAEVIDHMFCSSFPVFKIKESNKGSLLSRIFKLFR